MRELPSSTTVLSAIRSGRIDIAALTLDEALRLEHDGIRVRVLRVMDVSNGAPHQPFADNILVVNRD